MYIYAVCAILIETILLIISLLYTSVFPPLHVSDIEDVYLMCSHTLKYIRICIYQKQIIGEEKKSIQIIATKVVLYNWNNPYRNVRRDRSQHLNRRVGDLVYGNSRCYNLMLCIYYCERHT